MLSTPTQSTREILWKGMENRAVPHHLAFPCLAPRPRSGKETSRQSWPEQGHGEQEWGYQTPGSWWAEKPCIHPSLQTLPDGGQQGVWCAAAAERQYRLRSPLPQCRGSILWHGLFQYFRASLGFTRFPYAPKRLASQPFNIPLCYGWILKLSFRQLACCIAWDQQHK